MKINFLIFLTTTMISGNVFAKQSRANFVEGEILVKYKANVSSLLQKDSIEREGAVRISRVTNKGLARVKLDRELDMDAAIADFKKDANVEYAQPNYIYHTTAVPNDPRYSQLWALKNTGQTIVAANGPDSPRSSNNPGLAGKDMGMEYAWNNITDCSSVVVAVLDTGINYNHSDLVANMWDGGVSFPKHGYDYIDTDNDPMDSNGHGTHVAGTIGAVGNNATGATGVCWNAKLMGVRVLGTDGSGTTAGIISGVDFAVAHGAKVINMSLGGGSYDPAFNTAITNAQSNGVVVVVAAGNDGENNDTSAAYPCSYPQSNIVCVAALTQNYSLASFSNFGLNSVDVGAPGVNIVSLWPGAHAELTDPLTSGWNFSSTTAGGWGYKSLNFGEPVSCLVNPTNYNYGTAKYGNNMDARAWKTFNIASVDAATLNFNLMYDTQQYADFVSIYAKAGSADPMAAGDNLDFFSGTTDGYSSPVEYDLTPYKGAPVSIGFKLSTDSTGVDKGTNISKFYIKTLTYNTTTYNVISGTSMASPQVAGLAAMIYAFNPSYAYSDVVSSITKGGVALSALAGITTSGKSVSAIGSLNYINAPTGGAAVIVP